MTTGIAPAKYSFQIMTKLRGRGWLQARAIHTLRGMNGTGLITEPVLEAQAGHALEIAEIGGEPRGVEKSAAKCRASRRSLR
jgi:hypothetical protein